jgi:hypothetical protein
MFGITTRLVSMTKFQFWYCAEDGVYEKLVRRQLHKASNPILDDLGAEDTSDNISTLLDDTSSHT